MGRRILFLVLVAIGVGALIWGYGSYKKSQEAKSWPTTEGKVISSEVDSRFSRSKGGTRSRHKTNYSAKVLFEYDVDGKTYTSDKVSLAEYSSSVRSEAQQVVDKYPVNESVIVYYDPTNPEIAILEPGKLGGIVIPFIIGGMFVLCGILGAVTKKPT